MDLERQEKAWEKWQRQSKPITSPLIFPFFLENNKQPMRYIGSRLTESLNSSFINEEQMIDSENGAVG